MKKILFVAALALVASAACTKTELSDTATPDVEIGFQVASYSTQTKAESNHSFITELTDLGVATADQKFKSIAYIHADNGNGGTADPVQFFTAGTNGKEVISWNESAKEWAPAHTYYWPKAFRSNIDFFTWYDMAGTDPTVTFASPWDNVTMEWANRTVPFKDNVMWADAAWHYKDNVSTYNHDSAKNGVPTLFHHALAQVRFTINQNPMKEEDAANPGSFTFWEVKLLGVSIAASSVYNNGTLTLSQEDPDTKQTQAWTKPTNDIWTGGSTYATLDGTTVFNTPVAKGTTGSADVLLTADAQYLTVGEANLGAKDWVNMPDYYFTVRPQAVGDNVVITFKYQIKTYYGTQAQFDADGHAGCTPISTETLDVNDLGPAGANLGLPYTNTGIRLNAITGAWDKWQMNKKYTYNFTINPKTDKILYDPAVENWADDVHADRVVPQPAA